MEDVTLGPFLIASGLLIVTGAFKVVSPSGVTGAIGAIGARVPRWAGRVLGLGEMTLGVSAFVVPGRSLATMVALGYLVLAGVVLLLRRRGAESCGCFGEITSPPSLTHLSFNLMAAVAAAAHTAVGGTPPIEQIGIGSPGGWPLIALLTVVGIGAALTLLTALPAVLAETEAARAAAERQHDRDHGREHRLGMPVKPT